MNINNPITSCDINYDSNQICIFFAQAGTISVLDLETSIYNLILRSHLGNVQDLTINFMMNKIITVGDDYCVKVWDSDSMEQLNEFVSQNDLLIRVIS